MAIIPTSVANGKMTRSSTAALRLLNLIAITFLVPDALTFQTRPISFTHHARRASSIRTRVSSSFSATTTVDEDETNGGELLHDVVICGAGPAGLLLASALSQKSSVKKIAIVDPTLESKWPNNYGVWMDEAEHFGYDDCCDYVWKEAGVVFDEDTPEVVLDRPYGRVDRIKLKKRLLDECQRGGGGEGGGAAVSCYVAKATDVRHFDDGRPSVVTTRSAAGVERVLRTLLVVDATGFSRQFTKHENDFFDPGFQVTYGARMRVKDLGPYSMDRMVLMDYAEQHLYSEPDLVKSNERFPSFVYVMPLSEDEIFMEETVLVSRPGASSRDLKRRLELRMKALGIENLETLEDERAAIPMGGTDPIIPQRTLGFGATSSLVHPASGYMVARAMELAPRVADEIAPRLRDAREEMTRGGGRLRDGGVLEELSAAGWNAVWPTDERRQRDFMHFGFELLCLLNPQELRDFFTGFFRLPDALWEHFLSWRLSGVGHVVMGLRVWAQCIPRRFMPAMLIKSLPFIGNRLAGPFLSRGGFAKIDGESVYADARTGNYTLWEPDQYYKYLEDLKNVDYDGPANGQNGATEKMGIHESDTETSLSLN